MTQQKNNTSMVHKRCLLQASSISTPWALMTCRYGWLFLCINMPAPASESYARHAGTLSVVCCRAPASTSYARHAGTLSVVCCRAPARESYKTIVSAMQQGHGH
eukprot:470278-Pelagomonas_calceolata.AAC.1